MTSSTQSSTHTPEPLLGVQLSCMIAGGVAGGVSRTIVSPLERLKIIQQVQPAGGKQYAGVWNSLVRIWQEEGWKGYMRGNGINCVRIIPYSAVQFTTYEQLKKVFVSWRGHELDTPTRLLAGALAGITSVSATYPLDLVRARLSIASASISFNVPKATAASSPMAAVAPVAATIAIPPSSAVAGTRAAAMYHTSAAAASAAASTTVRPEIPGMWEMTLKVMREEGGVRALYRGLVPTALGVAPYVGINFAAYEALRARITPPGKQTVTRKLACGALAGSISQTLTYPFDVLRRKMQVRGLNSLGLEYTGAIDALATIVRKEGIQGLYRGLWPNCVLKVAPSIATSFYTYELVKGWLIPA
ncbi:mitochondrial carrier [Auriculariales sp. MPI-PUGE-AT-0066]|nr:mitochondrial carrier [Auriculariales sp. MPI-PUGE-AT-0066]